MCFRTRRPFLCTSLFRLWKISIIKMISYERVFGNNKNKNGVKCMICNHYYFKDKIDYQPYVCNDSHDFSMSVMDLNDYRV